jgi:tetratricopeptide (TPR) repeat protein
LLDIKGSKAEGIEIIRQAADAEGETSIDAKTALSLFLLREHRYPEAFPPMHELYRSYPHNFLYGLSEADILRSSGKVSEAVTAYRNLLAPERRNMFSHPRFAKAAMNLGLILRSQNEFRAAAEAFDSVEQMTGADRQQMSRANLLSGEMYDSSHDRVSAIHKYQEVIGMGENSADVQEARSYLKRPYQ